MDKNREAIKPNFFIAGAAKCATTSVYRYLKDHPQVFMSPVKEPKFFSTPCRPLDPAGPGDQRVEAQAIKDMDEYLSLFQGAQDYPVRGEASVDYLYYHQTAEDIHAFNPDARILICLRNPIDRAYSGYTDHSRSRETLPFHEALAAEDASRADYEFIWQYKKLGLYYESVKHYLDVFGPEQVLIVFFEDIKAHLSETISRVCRFLAIDDYHVEDMRQYNPSGEPSRFYQGLGNALPWVKALLKKIMPGRYARFRSATLQKEPMTPEDRAYLLDYYRDDIENLSKLLGKDLRHWMR